MFPGKKYKINNSETNLLDYGFIQKQVEADEYIIGRNVILEQNECTIDDLPIKLNFVVD